MKSLYCDVILFNGWGILWRGVICLRNKVFAAYQFIVSPVDLPKLGPCPLTGVACSLVNKGLVLWDLCCVYTTIHSPVSCVGQRLKPGQCLSLETCGTAFTNLGWIQTKMYPTHEFSGVQRLFFYLSSLRSSGDQHFDRNRDLFPRTQDYKTDTETIFSENNKEIIALRSNILGPRGNKWSQKKQNKDWGKKLTI